MRRTVLYLLPSFGRGGAETSLVRILERIDRKAFSPVVCALSPGGPLRGAFEDIGVPTHELAVGPGIRNVGGAGLVRLLVRYRPAVVHARLILASLWARSAKAFGSKVVTEERGLAHDRPLAVGLLNRITSPLSDALVANSAAVAHIMTERDGVPERRIRIIRGGVDTAKFVPAVCEPRFDFVSVARLERYKGVLELVDAMRLVVAQRPKATLAFVGGGSLMGELRERVSDARLVENVHFLGEQKDVRAFLHEARVAVLASYEEGLPNAAMEAMASGKPVVATAVGGNRELVIPGETGLLVPPRDPSALATALLDALGDELRLVRWGEAARRRIESAYSLNATVAAYEALYRELCG